LDLVDERPEEEDVEAPVFTPRSASGMHYEANVGPARIVKRVNFRRGPNSSCPQRIEDSGIRFESPLKLSDAESMKKVGSLL
jgi:hypothetical protein